MNGNSRQVKKRNAGTGRGAQAQKQTRAKAPALARALVEWIGPKVLKEATEQAAMEKQSLDTFITEAVSHWVWHHQERREQQQANAMGGVPLRDLLNFQDFRMPTYPLTHEQTHALSVVHEWWRDILMTMSYEDAVSQCPGMYELLRYHPALRAEAEAVRGIYEGHSCLAGADTRCDVAVDGPEFTFRRRGRAGTGTAGVDYAGGKAA
jgi:hypothetical protein